MITRIFFPSRLALKCLGFLSAYFLGNEGCSVFGEDWTTEKVLAGHKALITSVCFSSDARTLISASYDGTVRVWDVRSGNCALVINGEKGYYFARVLTRKETDDCILASSIDGFTQCWTKFRQDSNPDYTVPGKLEGLSRDGRHGILEPAGSGPVGYFTVFEISTGKILWGQELEEYYKQNGHYIIGIENSKDFIACRSIDGSIIVENLKSRNKSRRINAYITYPSDVVTSPRGSYVAGIEQNGHRIRIWNVRSAQLSALIEGDYWIGKFSPSEGEFLGLTKEGIPRLVRSSSGAAVCELKGHSDKVYCVCFSGRGDMIATAGHDKEIRVWKKLEFRKSQSDNHSSEPSKVNSEPSSGGL